ncbi:MAG: metallophosphoesterase, partial [Gammaproteobacteria bacterium]
MRLVQITDTHVYADADARFDGVDTRASLIATLAVAAAEPGTDHLLISGDVSMDETAGSYAWLAEALAARGLEALLLPGNHDDPAVANGAFAPTPQSLEGDGWRVHLLDTRIPGKPSGRLGPAALDWLDAALARAAGSDHALVMHHPPLPVGSEWIDRMGLEDADALWRVLEAHERVRLVAAGHVHQNFDAYHRGVRVVTTPSSCVQFLPRSRRYGVDRRAPGYRVIDLLAGGRVDSRVVRVA